jgi:hypothetical protein
VTKKEAGTGEHKGSHFRIESRAQLVNSMNIQQRMIHSKGIRRGPPIFFGINDNLCSSGITCTHGDGQSPLPLVSGWESA